MNRPAETAGPPLPAAARPKIYETREGVRLLANQDKTGHWNRWGPFLSERAWGTVREDYSANGDAWAYFPHDHARSKAYRWNEDGLGGISDRHQYLCFALALWNGRDPFLKERVFGLSSGEGNHGEDVKEYYYYLDNTPTHSYMKYLYKYPQAEYPYQRLVDESRRRTKLDPEFELVDTGIFDEGRYFDVFVEYAKRSAEDLLIRISITNRGPDAAPIHALPTLWFRNTWTWGRDDRRPSIALHPSADRSESRARVLVARHWQLGEYWFCCPGADAVLFTENETNLERLYAAPSPTPYAKDAFHAFVVSDKAEAVNPAATGTKAAALYARTIASGETITLDLRLASATDHPREPFLDGFEAMLTQRRAEADEFYGAVVPASLSAEERLVARQAFAGTLWSKQYYHYVLTDWLEGDPLEPPPPATRRKGRNHEWTHFFTRDVIAMPDKWEFPWFASWDLGFHCATLAHVDPSVRQGTDPADAAGVVHAPERADPRLRVGFRGRESAHPVTGGEMGLRHRAPSHGRRGPRVPRTRVPEDAPQLHLVGQPEGRARQEHLPGRLPRDGQHRRLRPRQAPARVPAGAGRWHQLDGGLRQEHAVDRPGAGGEESCLRGPRQQVLGAFHLHRRCDERPQQPRHVALGRAGRVLLRPPDLGAAWAVPGPCPHHGGLRADVRRVRGVGRHVQALPGIPAAPPVVHRAPPPSRRERGADGRSRRSTTPRSSGSCDRISFGACSRTCWTRTSFSRRTACGRCPATIWITRSCFTWTGRSIGWTTSRASRRPTCSEATPTGAARSGCPSTSSSCGRSGSTTGTTATRSESSARPARGG